MRNKFRVNHFNIPIIVGHNVIAKMSVIGIIIGILVLMPYSVKIDQFLPFKDGAKPISSSAMSGVALNKNFVDRSSFDFKCGRTL